MRKKAVLLCFVLLLTLGSAGAGYARWSQPLYTEGTVETGTFGGRVYARICADIEDKNVGTTSAVTDATDPTILHFTIDNGYPCYEGDCEWHIVYTGSIPAHVDSISFVPGLNLTNCTWSTNDIGQMEAYCDQLTVIWYDSLCIQLHQGNEISGSILVHVEQDAVPDTTYTFDVLVELVQYNESSCP